jgi:hypothetical protein
VESRLGNGRAAPSAKRINTIVRRRCLGRDNCKKPHGPDSPTPTSLVPVPDRDDVAAIVCKAGKTRRYPSNTELRQHLVFSNALTCHYQIPHQILMSGCYHPRVPRLAHPVFFSPIRGSVEEDCL